MLNIDYDFSYFKARLLQIPLLSSVFPKVSYNQIKFIQVCLLASSSFGLPLVSFFYHFIGDNGIDELSSMTSSRRMADCSDNEFIPVVATKVESILKGETLLNSIAIQCIDDMSE